MNSPDEALRAAYGGDSSQLRELRRIAGMSIDEAAAACLVSRETYRRWETDRKAPAPCARLMAILAGYVPWSGWDGWVCHEGLLYSPGTVNSGTGPEAVRGLPYLKAMAAEYQRKDRLRQRQEQPGYPEAVQRLVNLVTTFSTEAHRDIEFLASCNETEVCQEGNCGYTSQQPSKVAP